MTIKEVPAPGYTTTKTLLPSISLMFNELGAQDACIQLQELSIEYLSKSANANGETMGEFLRQLYRANNIPHGTHNFDELRDLASRSYLIVTYTLLEKMLRGVIAEYQAANPTVIENWKYKNDKENFSPLQELAHNVSKSTSIKLQSYPEYKLLEYYRLVRVANSHAKGNALANAEKTYKTLSATDIAHIREYAPGTSPNQPDSVNFDDFALFTRAIKYFSKILNEACA